MQTLNLPAAARTAGSNGVARRRLREPTVANAPTELLAADGFMQILAHELRGPLAPLRNAGALLRHAGCDRERLAQVADLIDRQVTTMSHLIDDVMDAFRLGLGHVAIHAKPIDLVTAVVTAVEGTRGFVTSRGHALVTTFPNHALAVLGDPARLAQVVANLVTNAAKYTNRGGTIEVRVDALPQCAVVTVSDDGIGLSAGDIGSIFELYAQAGQCGTLRSEGGLGIGLFLARELVEAQGGTLDASSAGRGHGSEFVVRLPRCPPSW